MKIQAMYNEQPCDFCNKITRNSEITIKRHKSVLLCEECIGILKDLISTYQDTPLEESLDTSTMTLEDRRALIQDLTSSLHRALKEGFPEIAKICIRNGADINAKNRWDNKRPLHLALEQGHPEIAKLLIEKVADINARDLENWAPLHYSAHNGYTEITELLLEKGADINVQDNWDQTPLHLASEEGYTEIAKLLIDKGADINIRDQWGRTPLDLAINQSHADIVELLKGGIDNEKEDKV